MLARMRVRSVWLLYKGSHGRGVHRSSMITSPAITTSAAAASTTTCTSAMTAVTAQASYLYGREYEYQHIDDDDHSDDDDDYYCYRFTRGSIGAHTRASTGTCTGISCSNIGRYRPWNRGCIGTCTPIGRCVLSDPLPTKAHPGACINCNKYF